MQTKINWKVQPKAPLKIHRSREETEIENRNEFFIFETHT